MSASHAEQPKDQPAPADESVHESVDESRKRPREDTPPNPPAVIIILSEEPEVFFNETGDISNNLQSMFGAVGANERPDEDLEKCLLYFIIDAISFPKICRRKIDNNNTGDGYNIGIFTNPMFLQKIADYDGPKWKNIAWGDWMKKHLDPTFPACRVFCLRFRE